jgi:hypothetical protein
VNVPYRLIDDPDLVAGLDRLLSDSPIEPRRLTLEIVPSGPGAGSELDEAVVARLRALGVKLSLDDLGRASSVAAIRMLQLDQVKIDAMFLHDAGRGGRADAIVRSLVELAHGLGLETVAEGVESKLAWEAALALGCDYAQGFYLGHPMSPPKLADWLAGDVAGRRASRPRSEQQRRRRRRERDDRPDGQHAQEHEQRECERGVADTVDRRREHRVPERAAEQPTTAAPIPASAACTTGAAGRATRAAARRRGAGMTAGRSRRARCRRRDAVRPGRGSPRGRPRT